MSFRVLVIPEDPTHNGYILRPLVERMLTETGKPNARVTILTNPKLSGYDHAVAAIRNELTLRYRHLDLWLFMPDADKAGRLATLEKEAEGNGVRLFCCAAKPFLKKHGDPRSAGSGREALTRATLANYRGLLEVCPELKELHHRLQALHDT